MTTNNRNSSTIACGNGHSVALLTNGTVRCWGDDDHYQCYFLYRTFTDVIQVACGLYHSVVLLSNGTIKCWGDNKLNQCDPVHLTFTDVMIPCTNALLW